MILSHNDKNLDLLMQSDICWTYSWYVKMATDRCPWSIVRSHLGCWDREVWVWSLCCHRDLSLSDLLPSEDVGILPKARTEIEMLSIPLWFGREKWHLRWCFSFLQLSRSGYGTAPWCNCRFDRRMLQGYCYNNLCSCMSRIFYLNETLWECPICLILDNICN